MSGDSVAGLRLFINHESCESKVGEVRFNLSAWQEV